MVYGELWETEKKILEATLRIDKYLDTYICAFSSECKLLTQSELDRLKATKTIDRISNAGSSSKTILEYFPKEFFENSKIVIISDMILQDIDDIEGLKITAEERLREAFEKKGVKKVILFKVDEDMAEFYQTAEALEISKEEEKATKQFEPTIKAK